jgi:hypothetical protein
MSRRIRYIITIGITTLVVIAAFFAVSKPSSPSGRYVASSPTIVTGDFYYELSGGKVYVLDFENSGVTNRQELGTYFQTRDGWFYTMPPITTKTGTAVFTPVKIQCSWAGLSFLSDSGSNGFWRRRLIAGKRPEWMTLYLPWNLQ